MAGRIQEIQRLKKEHHAVILAHNYQLDEVQAVADFVGDSFYLSKMAAASTQDVIVFCGVLFMAETAKLLSPDKTVLLPEKEAGCPLADMITAEELRSLKAKHPGVPVVCYINSSAEVKAQSDICCTSANAVQIVASLPGSKVIFVPDEHLGDYVARQVPEKELILWKGNCVTHAKVKPRDVEQARRLYPGAKILIHPECHPDVVKQADFAGSTSDIIRYAKQSQEHTFVIGTEMGVVATLQEVLPDKKFFLLHSELVCPTMKKTTIDSVYRALQYRRHEIHVEAGAALKAQLTLQKMLEVM